MNPYAMHEVAMERQRDAQRQAAREHLVRLVRCCKPSDLSRMVTAVRARLSRPQAVCC